MTNESLTLLQKIKESVDYINSRTSIRPDTGIILGSGLGDLVIETTIRDSIAYRDIPHFPVSEVEGHAGNLVFAVLDDQPLVIMQGRIHYYEGYGMDAITYPIRVLKTLGIGKLLLSNAAGGMNPNFKVGDLMMITDHINLMPNPLIGKHIPEFGPRFPDMSEPYDRALLKIARQVCSNENVDCHEGCYVAMTGPTYETPAEYNYLRIIGADAVGMSTVPEVIVAKQMGIRCFALSVITDIGIPGKIEFLTHEMVQTAAAKAEPEVATIIKGIIRACS